MTGEGALDPWQMKRVSMLKKEGFGVEG